MRFTCADQLNFDARAITVGQILAIRRDCGLLSRVFRGVRRELLDLNRPSFGSAMACKPDRGCDNRKRSRDRNRNPPLSRLLRFI
jgi:hypothetical protein